MCRSKHVEQLRNIGIISSITRSHLVGYLYAICIVMHGSMNINFIFISVRNLSLAKLFSMKLTVIQSLKFAFLESQI